MDSLQASRIAGGNSAIGRRESDFYPTPPEVTVALLDFLRLPENTVIWEPAAAWNILWAIEMRCKKPECVDTPWKEEKA